MGRMSNPRAISSLRNPQVSHLGVPGRSDQIVKMEVGVVIFSRRGVERRGRESNFFPHGVEKEVGGRIFSSIIEERGK